MVEIEEGKATTRFPGEGQVREPSHIRARGSPIIQIILGILLTEIYWQVP